jgi:hypothetical protein
MVNILQNYKDKYPDLSYFTLISHFVIFIIPLVLVLMPKDFFDKGTSLCLSKTIAGIECYACGMTRAIMHLIHFDFETAWNFNKLSLIVFPLLIPLWVKSALITFQREIPKFMKKHM